MRLIKPRQTKRGLIHYSEIVRAYRRKFRISFFNEPIPGFFIGRVFRFADEYYREANENTIGEVLRADLTDRQKWIRQLYDCDDFTFSGMGAFHHNGLTAAMPIFITWILILPDWAVGSRWRRAWYWLKVLIGVEKPIGHSLLSFYRDGEVQLIEVQTDEFVPILPNYRLILLMG